MARQKKQNDVLIALTYHAKIGRVVIDLVGLMFLYKISVREDVED